MLGLKMCFHRAVTFLVLLELSTVCADMNLAKLFGANINNEDAWGKLMELENCPKPQSMGSTIIMVNESLTAGAKFIANPNVTSRFECEFECCYKKKESCNIAVYTAEQKHCYLFNCGQPSICRFDQRDGYTVSLMSETISAKETSVAAPLTKPVTKPQSTTEAAPKQLHILDGCRPAIDKCVTANTECSDKGFCMCKKGFHPKNGVCRKDCLQGLEFECTNGESKYAQPDCIAVYDVCDGTPQCADGSDEKDCNKDSFDWSSLGSASQVKDKIKEYMAEHPDVKDDVLESKSTTMKSTPDILDIQNLLGQADHPSKQSADQVLSEVKPTTQGEAKVKPAVVSVVELKNSNGTVSTIEEAEEAVINKAKELSLDTSSRSAVIALSLSLTLTVLLVGYLSCRYKNMRSRVGRRDKAMRGPEVDYLIDGMYL